MALEKGSGPQPIAQVKLESEHVEEQVYYEQSDWENSYVEGTVVSNNHKTPDIYVDDSSYMYRDSQMECETVIVPAYQIRTHTGKRPYVCESCNMTVMPNNRPWNHIRVLGGGQPIVRHVYYMNFTRKSVCTPKAQSDKPKKVGKGKRTYPCDKCERVFGHKSHLDNHLRTHSGEKPFVCLCCDKRFRQKSNLTSHMRRYPLQCSKKMKSYPKIKEEPIEEYCFEVDSSEDVSNYTPLSQVPQDKNVHSAVVQSADVSQEVQLSTENKSTSEVLTKDTSQEKVSSLVCEEKDPSSMPSPEVDSCVVAATEVVRSQPHPEEVISSVTISNKEIQLHDRPHNSSFPSQVNIEVTKTSAVEESSSPPHLEATVNSQAKTENVISCIIAPKKVLFQIRSQADSSNAQSKQSLSQAESRDVTSSISGNKKKVRFLEKSFKIKNKSVVSTNNDSSQDKLSFTRYGGTQRAKD